ncbi:MAG: type II toxin-antitoxin system mRNA interferase toxin, RelE/StbE family, partial [Patescibacteria group bacterium]
MRKLLLPKSFENRLGLFLKKHPDAEKRVESVFDLLRKNLNDPLLKTHKLSGKLKKLWACSLGYEYR